MKLPRWSIEPLASLIDLLGPSFRLPFSSTRMRMSVQQMYCDTTKATRELNLEPAFPFLQAVQDIYEWYRARGQI
jgi:nucleoside-diphosphate-sugar epimerase